MGEVGVGVTDIDGMVDPYSESPSAFPSRGSSVSDAGVMASRGAERSSRGTPREASKGFSSMKDGDRDLVCDGVW